MRYSEKKKILHHYSSSDGIGNIYIFWGTWKNVIKAFLYGFENALGHPAQIHYALDYPDKVKNLDDAINLNTEFVFNKLGIKKGKVIELGCGIGGASVRLAGKYPMVSFTGITLSQRQAELANIRAAKLKALNARFIKGDFLKPCKLNNKFDGGFAQESLVHVADADKPMLFENLYKIIKKGGKISIIDGFATDKYLSKKKHLCKFDKIAEGWSLPSPISSWKFFIKSAKSAGFRLVSNENLTSSVLGSSKEIRNRAMLFFPVIKVARVLNCKILDQSIFRKCGFNSDFAFKFAHTCREQYGLFKEGNIEYRSIVLEK
ncbi:MAG: SAM-dependent methyltransferase [Candidatus Paceibacterota bacterium]